LLDRREVVIRSPRLWSLVTTCAIGAAIVLVVAGSGSARVSAGPTQLRLYAIVTKDQFVNNKDDRARGIGTNPFGNTSGTGTATTNERSRGPLPGDEGLYEFSLSDSASLSKSVGSGLFACEYGFGKIASCDFSYTLSGGTIAGIGSFNALATDSFNLTITGGTGTYRGVRGSVQVRKDTNPGAKPSATVTHNVPALVLEPEQLSVSLLPAATARATSLTRYSTATQEQFIDNGDDEVRGWSANPFGMRDPASEAAEDKDTTGPFPGDESLFKFAIRLAPKASATASATYTCLYAFDKNAFCDATYSLPGGSLIGAGAFAFKATRYVIPIVGGTGTYSGATGELDSDPGPNGTQRLTITLGYSR
jgi:hypothetical protein